MEPHLLTAVQAAQSGDLAQFGTLYDAYVKRVYDFLYFKALHRETAEDLTSQTFMKALEKINTYNPKRGEFVSWLYRIAQNTFIDYYRARKPSVDIDEAFFLSSGEDIPRDTEVRAQLQEVEKYLDTLPREERELILMRVWQGLSYAEISELTGRSEAALKMAFSRALKELKTHVGFTIVLTLFILGR